MDLLEQELSNNQVMINFKKEQANLLDDGTIEKGKGKKKVTLKISDYIY